MWKSREISFSRNFVGLKRLKWNSFGTSSIEKVYDFAFEKGMIFKDIEPQNYTDSILSAAVKIIMVSVTTIELNQSAVEKHLLAFGNDT